jgi:hypothetical protein
VNALARVREACAQVAERAKSVRIDDGRLRDLAALLEREPPGSPFLDPAHHHFADADTTLAYVVTLDAVNFGSGWFPVLRKRPGLSGYFTIAGALKERFEAHGAWDAAELGGIEAVDCARIFGQDPESEVGELMELFARALRDLGAFLEERYRGRFGGPIEEASGSAARLVEILTEMPLYRDVARYEELEVPFYKRAQLTAADLSAAFAGVEAGRFDDLDELTIFADNLVPHVLRCAGVLVYASELAARIDAEQLLPAGSPEEIEIRACAVDAVERCIVALRAKGGEITARQLDCALWNRGQLPAIKARPRHRTRTCFY